MRDIPQWLQAPVDSIQLQIKSGHLAHATIVDAPHGIGSSLLVESAVRQLLGLPADKDLHSEAYADLIWIDPKSIQLEKNLASRSAVIDIETIRNLIEYLQLSPSIGQYKVAVIEEAHLMTVQAANGFLKILEEPPRGRYIFMLTTEYASILPTIKSRCNRIKLQAPHEQESVNWLVQKGCEKESVSAYLRDLGPAPFDVLDAYQKEDLIVEQKLLEADRKPAILTDIAAEFTKQDPYVMLARWQRCVHRIAKQSVSHEDVMDFFDELSDVKRQLMESPALNWQLQYERLLILWLDLNAKLRQMHRVSNS